LRDIVLTLEALGDGGMRPRAEAITPGWLDDTNPLYVLDRELQRVRVRSFLNTVTVPDEQDWYLRPATVLETRALVHCLRWILHLFGGGERAREPLLLYLNRFYSRETIEPDYRLLLDLLASGWEAENKRSFPSAADALAAMDVAPEAPSFELCPIGTVLEYCLALVRHLQSMLPQIASRAIRGHFAHVLGIQERQFTLRLATGYVSRVGMPENGHPAFGFRTAEETQGLALDDYVANPESDRLVHFPSAPALRLYRYAGRHRLAKSLLRPCSHAPVIARPRVRDIRPISYFGE
jgi:hypothetical protein